MAGVILSGKNPDPEPLVRRNSKPVNDRAGPETARKIGILLLPQFSYLELGLLLEPLFILNWLVQRPVFEWQLFSIDGKAVPATNGLSVGVDGTPPADDEFAIIFVLASFETKTYANDRSAKLWLRRQASQGVEVGGIQTGTEVLAAAGLLDGYSAVVHWDNLDGFQELYPEVRARPELYAVEPGRLTCAGGTAVLDMMLCWLEESIPAQLTSEIKQHLVETRIRRPTETQIGAVGAVAAAHAGSDQVRRAIRIMQRTLEEPLPCPEIAARVGLSRRQLERRFKQATGLTPLRYYMSLRLKKAHRLLQQTDLSVAEVAAGAGFESLEHFSRVYRATFGCPPSSDRMQSTRAPVMRQGPIPIKSLLG